MWAVYQITYHSLLPESCKDSQAHGMMNFRRKAEGPDKWRSYLEVQLGTPIVYMGYS